MRRDGSARDYIRGVAQIRAMGDTDYTCCDRRPDFLHPTPIRVGWSIRIWFVGNLATGIRQKWAEQSNLVLGLHNCPSRRVWMVCICNHQATARCYDPYYLQADWPMIRGGETHLPTSFSTLDFSKEN